ncbi:hypothetical protein ACIA8K_12675 [Catenuloplanes sp. NPDC051500]|uniref:hypothetical protein n=1 Tax=Catenuloplanes sp. NPDC051500 TaxID=3363959 RepID=UPI00378B34CF
MSESAEIPTETTEETVPAATEDDGLDLAGARAALSKVRAEAGKYRTRLREAEAKLAAAKSPEDFEAAVNELRQTNSKLERDLLVEKVARTAQLPDELAELLQGSTEPELKAHAAKLQKFVTPAKEPVGELSGGLDPNEDEAFDPVKAARAARASRW